MKRLLYITNGIKDPAGLERVLSIKASAFADLKRYEVHIVVLNHNGAVPFYTFSPLIHLHDVAVKGNAIKYFWSYAMGLRKLVNRIQPDLILVCDDGLKGFFLPLLLPKKVPMVYERHVSKVIELGLNPSLLKRIRVRFKFFIMEQLGKRFDRFVVLTASNCEEWKMKNVRVIANPLSFYPEKSAQLIEKKVIAVGKQSFQKGYDRLLDAWAAVVKKYPDWKLEIYGKKAPKENLESLACTLKIESTVAFYDPTSSIQEKYLNASLFVLSSRFEGFGMVLIEAMACGLPCVSFDCPHGPKDIIRHDEDGFLVENDNNLELSAAIQKLIANEELRIQMGQNARNNVRRFLPEPIIQEWEMLFKELI
jgi:glycosyltransferase involved in cell wall biosynthesis